MARRYKISYTSLYFPLLSFASLRCLPHFICVFSISSFTLPSFSLLLLYSFLSFSYRLHFCFMFLCCYLRSFSPFPLFSFPPYSIRPCFLSLLFPLFLSLHFRISFPSFSANRQRKSLWVQGTAN